MRFLELTLHQDGHEALRSRVLPRGCCLVAGNAGKARGINVDNLPFNRADS